MPAAYEIDDNSMLYGAAIAGYYFRNPATFADNNAKEIKMERFNQHAQAPINGHDHSTITKEITMKRFMTISLMALFGAVLFTGCSRNAKNPTSVLLPAEPALTTTQGNAPSQPRYSVLGVKHEQIDKVTYIYLNYGCSLLNDVNGEDQVVGILYSGTQTVKMGARMLLGQPAHHVDWALDNSGLVVAEIDSLRLSFSYGTQGGPITESYSIDLRTSEN
jgi:hypothetical protein